MRRPSSILTFVCAGLLCMLAACQRPAVPADARDDPSPPAPVAMDRALEAAIDAAQSGRDEAASPLALQSPAAAWIEYARLRRDLDTLPIAQGEAFLAAHPNDAVGRAFREGWLGTLSQRGEWRAFLAAWKHVESASHELRCAWLQARLRTEPQAPTSSDWRATIENLWRTPKLLPALCDDSFDAWKREGGADDAQRWQRIEAALEAGEVGIIRATAEGLDEAQRVIALRYADALQWPLRALPPTDWPVDARSRAALQQALLRVARNDAANAETLLSRLSGHALMDASVEGPVRARIALTSASSYSPGSAARFATVPNDVFDIELRQLQVREAIARSDWNAARAALLALPMDEQAKSQSQYLLGRMDELQGREREAQQRFESAAKESDFFGFLAADKIEAGYALCPWMLANDDPARALAAKDPALQRSFALYRIGRKRWAVREWEDAMRRLDDAQRRQAVALAHDLGWFDRAVFFLAKPDREELRLYTLRFPMRHHTRIEDAAQKHGVDASWMLAEMRAESLFDASARSGANAIGLMQVLPGTATEVAKRHTIEYSSERDLLDPDTNIAIGAAYLSDMRARWGTLPAAIAAYNAGPTPVERWKTQRGTLPEDLWIATIPYKETREYVARVLAFSVIYDWRLHGDALRLRERMAGNTKGERARFACAKPVR